MVKLSKTSDIRLIGQIMAHHEFMADIHKIRSFLNDNNIPNTVVCTRDWCTCAADIPITKEKYVK